MDSDRRASARLETNIDATCRVPASPHAAKVVDLSATGCRVRLHETAVLQGSTVHLDMRPAAPVRGRVVWAAGRSAGIRFDRPLPESSAVLFGLQEAPVVETEPEDPAPPTSQLHHWIRRILDLGRLRFG